MARGLDHLVHLVRDLDAASRTYRRMGFQLGAENRHPFGTKNRLIQLPGFFIEVLAIADESAIPAAAPGRFSFAGFNADLLAQVGEGASMLVLESPDAEADRQAFEAAGVGGFERLDFARKGRRSDGAEVDLGFRLAFAASPAIPQAGFFTCEQTHPPENFWDPLLQMHPNGAAAVRGVVLTAENPSDHHVFFSALTGIRDFRASSSGLHFATPRGDVEVITSAAFAQRYGEAVDDRVALRALRIAADLVTAGEALASGDLPAAERNGSLVVPSSAGRGLVVAFEPA